MTDTTTESVVETAATRRAARIARHEAGNRRSRETALRPRFEMALQRHYLATGQDVTVVPGSGDVWAMMETFHVDVVRDGNRENASCYFEGRLLLTDDLVYLPAESVPALAA